jgi:hypothetical protein
MLNRVPILIGISGNRGSGKDTSFSYIEKWANENNVLAVRRAFADPLKFSFARIFFSEITLEDAIVWCNKIKENSVINAGDGVAVTGRQALQHYGFEAHRELFGDDFWIDFVLPKENWQEKIGEADICVITDVRLENEAKRIKDLGGVIWKIDRKLDTVDEHATEQGLPTELVDIHIMNINFNDLEIQISSLMNAICERNNA